MPEPPIPNFMIIGAAKAGTTSLAASLAAHPDVYLPAVKETGYFSWHAEYAKGLPHYLTTHYDTPAARAARACGDATPSYLCSPDAPGRIRRDLPPPSWRFVVVLREPIERAHSHYRHMVRTGAESSSFAEALETDTARVASDPIGVFNACYLYGSRYAEHLRRWQHTFPEAPFHLVLSEELTEEPAVVHRELCSFLGVDPEVELPVPSLNAGGTSRLGVVARATGAPKWVKRGWDRLLPRTTKQRLAERLDRWDTRPAPAPPIDPDLEARLRAELEPDVAFVEGLLGRELPHWRGHS